MAVADKFIPNCMPEELGQKIKPNSKKRIKVNLKRVDKIKPKTMTITDFTNLVEHPIINFRQLCNECGINYNTMWAKVDNERPLTEQESKQIEHYLQQNGINWQQLIQS